MAISLPMGVEYLVTETIAHRCIWKKKKKAYMRIQWSLSIVDAVGPRKCVLIRELGVLISEVDLIHK